jgi:hypothetical protein
VTPKRANSACRASVRVSATTLDPGYVAIHSWTANEPSVPAPTTHKSWHTFCGVSSPKLIFDDTVGNGPTVAPNTSSPSSDIDKEDVTRRRSGADQNL